MRGYLGHAVLLVLLGITFILVAEIAQGTASGEAKWTCAIYVAILGIALQIPASVILVLEMNRSSRLGMRSSTDNPASVICVPPGLAPGRRQ